MPRESSTCVFSPDLLYRYLLTHIWNTVQFPKLVMWIGLNPSTADEQQLDPTLRRVKGFSQSWGFDGFVMTNVFAYRATDPRVMMAASDPIGPDNDHHLMAIAAQTSLIVACWGVHARHRGRDETVKGLLSGRLTALKVTKDGAPGHPLYLPKTLQPFPYA